jgi:predicted transcriptional regulator
MKPLALTPAQQRRLVRLARDAGRTPKTMLNFVLRDGFDACEEDVRESRAADAEFAAGKGVAHKEAMKRARAAIESRAGKHKQAA